MRAAGDHDRLQLGRSAVGERLAVPEAGDRGARRAGVMREHLRLAPAGDVSRAAGVIGVKVGQDQPPQARRLVPGLADRLRDQGR